MATSVKTNFLPSPLISSFQQVLISRNDKVEAENPEVESNQVSSSGSGVVEFVSAEKDRSKPVVLVTNGDGIDSPGIRFLVEALICDARFDVHVCAPQSDRSMSGHSVTIGEKLAVCSAEISGATAYEVSGTPVDCVSLALSGKLFSWSKPVLVICGINKGSNCGHNMFYSGALAGAREAMVCGIPSLCISLNWKKDTTCESDLKDAVSVCLPVIDAVMRDIEKGIFPRRCLLNVEIPSNPLKNKGIKVTRQSQLGSSLSWEPVSTNKHPSTGHFMSNQQSLGIKLAQLSRDASATGAARRLNSYRTNVEIESVGVAAKFISRQKVKKYFRLELAEKKQESLDDGLDFRALEDGFIAITPLSLSSTVQSEIQTSMSNWIAVALAGK